MVDDGIDSANQAVKKYNERLDRGEFDKYQDVTGRRLSRVQAPEIPGRGGANMEGFRTTPGGVSYRLKGQ